VSLQSSSSDNSAPRVQETSPVSISTKSPINAIQTHFNNIKEDKDPLKASLIAKADGKAKATSFVLKNDTKNQSGRLKDDLNSPKLKIKTYKRQRSNSLLESKELRKLHM